MFPPWAKIHIGTQKAETNALLPIFIISSSAIPNLT